MIPNNPSLSYLAIALLFFGAFLLFSNLGIVNFQTISVSKSKSVRNFSFLIIILGIILFLFQKEKPNVPQVNPVKSKPIYANPPETQAYNHSYTFKVKGMFNVNKDWKKSWLKYLTYYKNFVSMDTPKGYYLLSSPDQHSYLKSSKEKRIEISGYIRTNQGIFYVTKYSFDMKDKEGFPKFIFPIK